MARLVRLVTALGRDVDIVIRQRRSARGGSLRTAASETVLPCARRAMAPSSLLRSRRRAVSGQAFHTSHHHTSQTGRPSATAQTAIATGPSSPAGSVTATVTAPSMTPAVQAPRR